MILEYDPSKNCKNIKKHNITLDEAFTSIHDPDAIWLYDGKHSLDEDRYISIGISSQGRVLFTVFTMRGEVYRIISSRRAERIEEDLYFGGRA